MIAKLEKALYTVAVWSVFLFFIFQFLWHKMGISTEIYTFDVLFFTLFFRTLA